MPRMGAVLLAAGGSQRFGSCKLVAELGGEPVIRRVARVLAESGVEEIVVVTGAERELVEAALGGLQVRFAHNANWAAGMGRSIATGLRALDGQGVDFPPRRYQARADLHTPFAGRLVFRAQHRVPGAQLRPLTPPLSPQAGRGARKPLRHHIENQSFSGKGAPRGSPSPRLRGEGEGPVLARSVPSVGRGTLERLQGDWKTKRRAIPPPLRGRIGGGDPQTADFGIPPAPNPSLKGEYLPFEVSGHLNTAQGVSGIPTDVGVTPLLSSPARGEETPRFSVSCQPKLSPDAAFIVPGDMPFLTAELLSRLVEAFDRAGPRSIVYPATRDGGQRNPVLWPRRFFPSLMALAGAEGAKGLLRSFRDEAVAVTVDDAALLADIDTKADLAAARARFREIVGLEPF